MTTANLHFNFATKIVSVGTPLLFTLNIEAKVIVEKEALCRVDDDVIGSGRYGVVVKARHTTHGECVIKMLHCNLLDNKARRANFVTECNMGAYIKGAPNLVQHLGVTMHNGLPCLIMEKLCTRYSLHTVLQQGPDDHEKCRVAHDVACGLQHLHSKKIALCLLDCNSILFDSTRTAKITNLGKAKNCPTDADYAGDKSSLRALLVEIDTGKCKLNKTIGELGQNTVLSHIAHTCNSQELTETCSQLQQGAYAPSYISTHANLALEGPTPVS